MQLSKLYSAADAFISNAYALNPLRISIGDLIVTKPLANPSNADLRRLGLRDASGIYVLLRPSREVIYIGKATKANLHQELWGKLKTPKGESPACKYPCTVWSGSNLDPQISKELMDGELLVAAFSVEPSICSSLIEVYLQTWCAVLEELPCLNAQIG